jgi:hypothetical protein
MASVLSSPRANTGGGSRVVRRWVNGTFATRGGGPKLAFAVASCNHDRMAKTFRLGDRDEQELERLADELDCTQVDVVRKGLLALRIMRKQGYSMDWAGGADIVLRREGDTVSWYTLTDEDELVLIGEQPAPSPRDK